MNRDEILGASDLATDTFDVPVWGSVTIRMMTGEQREEVENLARKGARGIVRATAAVYSMVSPDGQPVFTPKDAVPLSKKNGVSLDCVFGRVVKLNAMSQSEVDTLAGNSETAPTVDSGSS